MNFKYRPEIDGLRAIAVIPLILYHAGFPLFKGGFIGVDIFFAISGYLITNIIYSDLQNQAFSFSKFYERRIKRLFPALFLTILISTPFAFLLILPPQLKDFFQSISFITFFSSNILFWMESGYFEAASELKPLLHTWSLAIEEQFYFIFPYTLALMIKKNISKKYIIFIFILIFCSSLIFAQLISTKMPSVNFFLLPSRIWELLFGSVIALIFSDEKQISKSPLKNNLFSIIGIILIFLSIIFIDKNTPYPSLYTLIPLLGTGFIIISGNKGNLIHSFLNLKPLIHIGLLSYGLYLFHQPIFVYFKHFNIFYNLKFANDHEYLTSSLLILSTYILSYLSWKYYEIPIRFIKLKREKVFKISFTISILTLTIFGLFQTDFILARFFEKNEFSKYFYYTETKVKSPCFISSGNQSFPSPNCLRIAKDKKTSSFLEIVFQII